MTTLLLELPPKLYELLSQEAEVMGDSVETVAQRLLEEQLGPSPDPTERDRVVAVLHQAGLLTELGPEMQARANRSTAALEEVQATFSTTAGKPLSEIVMETRGPKR